MLPIAGVRHRATVRLRLSAEPGPPRLHQCQRLQRVRRLGSGLWLEYLADVFHLTRSGTSADHDPHDHKIVEQSGESYSSRSSSRGLGGAFLGSQIQTARIQYELILQHARHLTAGAVSTTRRQSPRGQLRFAMAPSATSAANKGFIGDGAVVSYVNKNGDNHETHGNGTSLCVRALQHLRICPHSSSRVE